MNIPSMNPNATEYTLTAIFRGEDYIFVWTDYETGVTKFTRWHEIPAEIYKTHGLARIFNGDYEMEKMDCTRVLNYGPAAGGIGEAGAFRIATCGERIDSLSPLLGFKKRNMVRRAIKSPVESALPFLERISGQFSVSYATLFYLLTHEFPENCGEYILMAKELERLHNHVWVMHKLAGDASQKVASAHLSAITEELLRLNLRVLGHRYGINYIRTGPRDYEKFGEKVRALHRWFSETAEELSRSRIFIDRLQGTATLSRDTVLENDIIGIPARASGVMRDSRKFGVLKDIYGDYASPMEKYGDSLSRFLVRVAEAERGFEILESINPKGCKFESELKEGFHYGFVEAPPGDLFMAVEIHEGRVHELWIRPPSMVMYHAFAMGIRGNVFTDFPFALDSFGAYFADADAFGRWF